MSLQIMDTKGAGIILRDNENRILLVFGSQHRKWSFPKGQLDDNESLAECAIRETKEETGLTVSIPNTRVWKCYDYVYFLLTDKNVHGSRRLCPADKEEIAYAKWLSENEIKNLSEQSCNAPLKQFRKLI